MSSFLRIDGEEVGLTGARLVWQRATSGGRRGFVFHLAAQGRRRILHLAAWAPGDRIEDLTSQSVPLLSSGPDAAVDGRIFAAGEVRFGRVRDDLAVVSLDGEVEDLDPDSTARSVVEADIRADVAAATDRQNCLGCGASLVIHGVERDAFVGGHRVQLVIRPVVCPDCTGFADAPRFCPACGTAYAEGTVHFLSDDSSMGYTATCADGHTSSGNLLYHSPSP